MKHENEGREMIDRAGGESRQYEKMKSICPRFEHCYSRIKVISPELEGFCIECGYASSEEYEQVLSEFREGADDAKL